MDYTRDKSPYRKRLVIGHFMMTSVCVTCFVLGYEYSKGSDGESDIPYFFPAMVLAVLNALGFVLVIIKLATKHNRSISRSHELYSLILAIGGVWGVLGATFAGSAGICMSTPCYHTRNTWENRGVAIAIMVIHAFTFIWFVKLIMDIGRAPVSDISPNPLKVDITMRKIKLKTQTGQMNISRTGTNDDPRGQFQQGDRTNVPSSNKPRPKPRPLGRSLTSSHLPPLPPLRSINVTDLIGSHETRVDPDQSIESRKRRVALKLKAMHYLKQTPPGKIPVIRNASVNAGYDGRSPDDTVYRQLDAGDFNKNQRFNLKGSKIHKKKENRHGKKSKRHDDKEDERETDRLLKSLQRRLENLERKEETEEDMTDTGNGGRFYPKPPTYKEAMTPRYTTEPMRREKTELDIINPYQLAYRPQPGHAESIVHPHNIYASGTAYPDTDIVVMHPTPLKRQSNLSSCNFSDK